jgi:hypothetical protein
METSALFGVDNAATETLRVCGAKVSEAYRKVKRQVKHLSEADTG